MSKLTCNKCGIQTVELVHRTGTPGEYCANCAPTFTRHDTSGDEVSGVVIGEIVTRFEFWKSDGSRMIFRTSCENQEQAVGAFMAALPAEFANGATLRIYD